MTGARVSGQGAGLRLGPLAVRSDPPSPPCPLEGSLEGLIPPLRDFLGDAAPCQSIEARSPCR
jgi:hypothetical protein